MMAPVYELREVMRSFQWGTNVTRALGPLSFEIAEGEFLAITGPSGCGKSTLLNLLGLLDNGYMGTLTVHGRSLSGWSQPDLTRLRLSKIGLVFQQFHLIDALDVLDNVAWPHWRLNGRRGPARDKARGLLARCGLADRMTFSVTRLSGGEQQRVAIARALVNDPVVLLADEPTGQLDEENTEHIADLLHQIHAQGTTVIAVSHDHQVLEAAERLVTLSYGRLVSDARGRIS